MTTEDFFWTRGHWYLETNSELAIGPFKTMTYAFKHRKYYGPEDATIEFRYDGFYGELFPPITPEFHRSVTTQIAWE